jgi:hypothetical protein
MRRGGRAPRRAAREGAGNDPGVTVRGDPTLRLPGWEATSLWWPEQRALVVAEALGTAVPWTGGQAHVGCPFLRAWPPGRIRERQPEHLPVGHGFGVHGPTAASALEQGYQRSRSDYPSVLKGMADQVFKR